MPSEEDLGVLQTIRDMRRRNPFIPFRIVMSSGESIVVENLELLAIGESQLVYCLPHSDRVAYLRLNQVSLVEDLGSQMSGGRR